MTRANDLSGQQHELPIKCRLDFINEMRSCNMNLFFRERGRINLNLDDSNNTREKKRGREGIGE
jgi:hypothetical protein